MDSTLDAVKTAPEKVHSTGAFLGNKIAEKIGNPKHMIDESLRNVKEIIIPPEKKEEILNELKQVLWKRNTIKFLSY